MNRVISSFMFVRWWVHRLALIHQMVGVRGASSRIRSSEQWVLLHRLISGVQIRRFTDQFQEFGQLLIFLYLTMKRRIRISHLNGIEFNLPAFGIDARADNARNAERFSSSCFSYSCFTAFAFTLYVHVTRNGSTNWSNSAWDKQMKSVNMKRRYEREKGKHTAKHRIRTQRRQTASHQIGEHLDVIVIA